MKAAECAKPCVGVLVCLRGLIWVRVALGNTARPELFFNAAVIGDVFMPTTVCVFDLAELIML